MRIVLPVANECTAYLSDNTGYLSVDSLNSDSLPSTQHMSMSPRGRIPDHAHFSIPIHSSLPISNTSTAPPITLAYILPVPLSTRFVLPCITTTSFSSSRNTALLYFSICSPRCQIFTPDADSTFILTSLSKNSSN